MQHMKAEHILTFPFAYNAQVSPKGDIVAFQVTKANEKKNCYETNLWFLDTKSGHVGPLTSSGKDGGFQFLKDGRILFSSHRGNDDKDGSKGTTYYAICPKGGEAQKLFTVELSVSGIRELGDGKYLVLGYEDLYRKSNYVEIEDLPFWRNGAGYTSGLRTGLYLFDATLQRQEEDLASDPTKSRTHSNAKDGEETSQNGDHETNQADAENSADASKKNGQLESGILKKLSEQNEDLEAWDLDADGKRVVFASSTYEHKMPLASQIFVYDLEKNTRHQISKRPASHYAIQWLGDKIVDCASFGDQIGLNENAQFYLYDADGKEQEPTKFSGDDFDAAVNNSVGTDARFGGGPSLRIRDGKIYFVTTEKDNSYLSTIDENGKITRVIEKQGTVESFDVAQGHVFFTAMRDLQLPELYVLDGAEETKLTNFSKALEGIDLAPVESFRFETNGAEVTGYVIAPLGHVDGQKAPGLLEVHGGPKTAFGSILHHEMQMLAAQGYYVFYTNPHGSDGYGDAFSDIRGKYGTIDYEDLMHFTDLVLEKYPDIDAERIGVLGGSYGGFMTNWIIGHTDRFRAANAQRSISNWTSFYGVSDIGWYFAEDQTQSTPWNDLDAIWEQSPLKHAKNAKTPTLFIHSDADYRCPLEQGIQMYNALRLLDVDTRLVVFKDETHELSRSGRPQGRLKRLHEISNWFATYLEPTANSSSEVE